MTHFITALKNTALAAIMAILLFIPQASASASDFESLWDKNRFQIRVRAISLIPDDSSTANIGGETNVGTSFVMPEVDVTYFLTEKTSLELIAATTPHEIDHSSGSNLGNVWALPPTLTLQYHPLRGENAFSPYIGAGINYTIFYGEQSGHGFTDLNVDNAFGLALQGGFDYWLNDKWGINFDVKKIYMNVDASLNDGAIETDIDLDPWVVGAGVSYKF